MKKVVALFFLFTAVNSLFAQKTYNNLAVIESKSAQAKYRVNNDPESKAWNISPELSPDVLSVPCTLKKNILVFNTDIDSIKIDVDANRPQQFYVKTADGKYALTEVRGFTFTPAKFDDSKKKPAYEFLYSSKENNDYLKQLRTEYNLDELVKGLTTDSARALRVVNWCHRQWAHNGNNEPVKSDALSILAEVKEGKLFRCVEYGIVTTSALQALGIPARVLGLKTKEADITPSGAGHVLLEVYLRDMKKWVLLDGQFDIMPVLNNIPLNAVEFQNAIANNYEKLEIRSLSGASKSNYTRWVYPYLYYMDIRFDNRQGAGLVSERRDGKIGLMLVPNGAKNLTMFQNVRAIDNVIYLHSLADFYAAPGL